MDCLFKDSRKRRAAFAVTSIPRISAAHLGAVRVSAQQAANYFSHVLVLATRIEALPFLNFQIRFHFFIVFIV